MKVAFATTDGINVNEHFGRAGMFSVYDLKQEGYAFVRTIKFADGQDLEIVGTKGMGGIHDEKVQDKVNSLGDCRIVYLTEIGGPSAARLIKKGVMPIKVMEGVSINESLEKLLATVRSSPPPWLRKALAEEEQALSND